ncbi:MAG: HAD family hydrolase [Nitrospiraceae bacterium]
MNDLRAIIFDFDGVIADTEPLHYAALREVLLAEFGIALTMTEYYADYLGYDDRGCFTAALTAHQRPFTPHLIDELVRKKGLAYLAALRTDLKFFPGVGNLIQETARNYRLAIASGALRHEIELILEQGGLRKAFSHITTAEDVSQGKPSPEPFLRAMAGLNALTPLPPLRPADCLVIEDSLPGIRGARGAGMKVLAVANTHTMQDLHEADIVVSSLEQVNISALASELWT